MNGNLPQIYQGSLQYATQKGLPAIVGLVAERNASSAFGKKTEMGQAATGLIGFSVGYFMIGSNMGTIAKNAGAGIAMGGVWDVSNALLQRFGNTSVEQILSGLFAPAGESS